MAVIDFLFGLWHSLTALWRAVVSEAQTWGGFGGMGDE